MNLLSISVNGQALPINPSVFSTSNGQGTIIDTGTTLAYLSEAAYVPFVEAVSQQNSAVFISISFNLKCNLSYGTFQITNAVSQSVRPVVSKGSQCYVLTTRFGSVHNISKQVFLLVVSNISGKKMLKHLFGCLL